MEYVLDAERTSAKMGKRDVLIAELKITKQEEAGVCKWFQSQEMRGQKMAFVISAMTALFPDIKYAKNTMNLM